MGGPLAARALARYDGIMTRQRLAAILCLVLLGLSLGGCTKCGWLWDNGGRACHSDKTR
jgi:hypothetical protein